MKVKISLLGGIGAIFGFVSLAVPWFLVSVDIPVIGIYDISISLAPYKILTMTLFDNLIIGQLLMIFGSILAILFLHKVELDGDKEYVRKFPFIGLIGTFLNILAIVVFFIVVVDDGKSMGIEPYSISVGFGLISAIISVVFCMLAFISITEIKNPTFLKKTVIIIDSRDYKYK